MMTEVPDAQTTFDQLSVIDRNLLGQLQEGIPLVPRPWGIYAERLGLAEEDVLDHVCRLKHERIIRQISAIFDSRALGYQSTLVAARVSAGRLQEAAEIINRHPGVSHNYEREHDFNLWYTVTVPPDSRLGLEGTVNRLHELSGAESTRLLPTLRLFKIGVRIQMGSDDVPTKSTGYTEKDAAVAAANPLQPGDRDAIRLLQKDLPLEMEPFRVWADELGVTQGELLKVAARLENNRQMRRFAAVLHHRRAGVKANAMGVWRVPADQIEAMGQRLAEFPEVSHCYHRPDYPDWPFQLFTMVHAPTRVEALAILDRMAAKVGIADKDRGALFSTREFKKVRVTYFTSDIPEWEAGL